MQNGRRVRRLIAPAPRSRSPSVADVPGQGVEPGSRARSRGWSPPCGGGAGSATAAGCGERPRERMRLEHVAHGGLPLAGGRTLSRAGRDRPQWTREPGPRDSAAARCPHRHPFGRATQQYDPSDHHIPNFGSLPVQDRVVPGSQQLAQHIVERGARDGHRDETTPHALCEH